MPFKDIFERATSEAMRIVARTLAGGRFQLEVKGLSHIPKHGPVLLVARHYHHLFDGVALLLSIPRPIHILVTLDWAKNSHIRRLMKLVTKMARWPVVLRDDTLQAYSAPGSHQKTDAFTAADINRYQRRALCASVQLLAEGRILVIFPEGYPNIDPHYTPKTQPDEFLPFKSGFTAIAAAAERRLGSRIPIIPTGFQYVKGSCWKARLSIGEAVYSKDFTSRLLLLNYVEQRVTELSA
jgi:1-acyl-sn-glycerol-3-phosphate acyltransferase